MPKYLKKRGSFLRMTVRFFLRLIRKKGVESEKEFSTYGMGMKVSHCMGTEEKT